MVAGRAKLLCDVTEEDQAVMSEEEHRAFYELCWASLGADGDGNRRLRSTRPPRTALAGRGERTSQEQTKGEEYHPSA
eukprot:1948374-Pleurochrysis_carterae.AAC.1